MKLRTSVLSACLLTWLFFGGTSNPSLASTSQPEVGIYKGLPEQNNRPGAPSPTLYEFIRRVKNGVASALVGVYIEGLLALPVEQQPSGGAAYVSDKPDMLTQFALASDYGSTGILAHNTLSGALFQEMKIDQEIYLVFGDGSMRQYVVKATDRFMALSPSSPYSDFMDLNHPGQLINSTNLFEMMYQTTLDTLVFQTCIANGFESSWGRLFVTALPSKAHGLPAGANFTIQ